VQRGAETTRETDALRAEEPFKEAFYSSPFSSLRHQQPVGETVYNIATRAFTRNGLQISTAVEFNYSKTSIPLEVVGDNDTRLGASRRSDLRRVRRVGRVLIEVASSDKGVASIRSTAIGNSTSHGSHLVKD
jgi:hypothetical protein